MESEPAGSLPMGIYTLLIGLVLVTLAGVTAGIKLSALPSISKRILPFSGGVLVGIALFWILPEIAALSGWTGGLAGLTAGFSALWLIDRYVYPVCPTCSHNHHHETCRQSLHGFAAPLLIAAGLHSFFDGWSLAVSQQKGFESLGFAFLAGIAVHKVPEGVALGAILLAATGSTGRTLVGAAAAQSLMVAGGTLGVLFGPELGVTWTLSFLAVAAGAFAYLGYHAIDSAYQERGVATSVMPALTGAVGAAVLRLGMGI